MPRQNGVIVENNFVKGLITETTGLRFPTDACSETWNCVFDETGRVTRRLGIDIEANNQSFSTTIDTTEAVSEYLWTNIKTYNDGVFLVQQKGDTLYFFDVTTGVDVTPNQKSFTVTLSSYQTVAGSSPGTMRCQFTQGMGTLFVVNSLMYPIYITYDYTTDTISVSTYYLYYRDMEGLEDGLGINSRPTASISGLASSNPQHLYNILNQGWYVALDDWDAARTNLPSNADVPAYYRPADKSSIFDNSLVSRTTPGNSMAPRGHYFLQVGIDDREAAAAGDGYSISLPDGSSAGSFVISRGSGSNFSGGTLDSSDRTSIFDSNNSTYGLTNASTIHYYGKDYGGTTYTPSRATVNLYKVSGSGTTITIEYYGSNSAPAGSDDGTLLGTSTKTMNSGDTVTTSVFSGSYATAYRYHWIRISTSNTHVFRIYYTDFYRYVGASFQPSVNAFFAGRLFYAGVQDANIGSNIYFTQILERLGQAGWCFQSNDPTSMEIADLLSSDGGVIRIPDIGQVQRLFNFQNNLLIMASNGVWMISGAGDDVFSATGYSVKKLSSIGMTSPQSVIDVKGLPVWWAEDGIYTVKYDANYGSVVVEPISENSIKTFFLEIPTASRAYAKGAYDRVHDIAYWIYNASGGHASGSYVYDRVLALNAKTNAFYPWSIGTSATTPQLVRSIIYVQDGLESTTPAIKLLTSYSSSLFYSEFRNTSYKDWTDYSTLITTVSADETDYESYFVSGYRVDGKGILFVQTPYVYWYLEPETSSYAKTQALFDWTTSGNEGKWSTIQAIECTPTNKPNRELGVFRRKYRGKGKALQLKVRSDSGKPFTLIGWGIFTSVASQV